MSVIRPEITGRGVDTAAADIPGIGHNKGPPLPSLTALELERHISIPEAAALKGVSVDTFKRHFKHLIRRISPRRNAVKLRDLLAEDTAVA